MLETLIEPEIKHSSQIITEDSGNREPLWKKIKSINYRKLVREFFSKKTVVTMQNDGKVFLSLMSFLGLVIIFLVDFCLNTYHS